MSPRKPKDDAPVEGLAEEEFDLDDDSVPMPANPGMPAANLDEPLVQGDDIRGGIRFVALTHPDTGGTQSVPEHLVEHWAGKGWTPALPIDDQPTTGAPEGDLTPKSEED